MRFLNPIFKGVSIEIPPFLATRSLASHMLLLSLPLLCVVFIVIFFAAGQHAKEMINHAISRSAQLQAEAASRSLEHLLNETRNQLLFLAAGSIDKAEMLKRLNYRAQNSGLNFRELAFMGAEPADRYLLLLHKGEIISIPPETVRDIPASPFQSQLAAPQKGHVSISRALEVNYPLVPVQGELRNLSFHALRFATPVYGEGGKFAGILSLSLDLHALRDKLCPLPAYGEAAAGPQSRGFFFDQDGWMIFQSEEPEDSQKGLGSDIVRAGFMGDFGRPGCSLAFRPSPDHLNYWTMVSETLSMRSGLMSQPLNSASFNAGQLLQGGASFAPVAYQTHSAAAPQVVGGIALLEDNPLAASSGRHLLEIYLIALFVCVILSALCLWRVTRNLSLRLNMLTAQIDDCNKNDTASPLAMPPMPMELENLRDAVEGLLSRLRLSKTAEQARAAARTELRRRQPSNTLPQTVVKHVDSMIGESPLMRSLYQNVQKAAQADIDVLVIGETGTGKELVASSIHSLSARAQGPFISINCGALDESLLMDTLFGHVRGAFTEAREGRKGAFLAANGGTLLLDEIGNAPFKVQKALLRALSTRAIRPLGSDEDIPFDTRIIAATNAPLQQDMNNFRSDLYYRLAVITIETPPLRERREDIPDLISYFMMKNARGASLPAMSNGALELLQASPWPGNVRELENVIARAMAFCNGRIIMAEDLRLAGQPPAGEILADSCAAPEVSRGLPGDLLDQLNPRQRKAWPELARMKSVSRLEYQQLAGDDISPRTAQYDLKILVRLGLLKKQGRGPSLRYMPVRNASPDLSGRQPEEAA